MDITTKLRQAHSSKHSSDADVILQEDGVLLVCPKIDDPNDRFEMSAREALSLAYSIVVAVEPSLFADTPPGKAEPGPPPVVMPAPSAAVPSAEALQDLDALQTALTTACDLVEALVPKLWGFTAQKETLAQVVQLRKAGK